MQRREAEFRWASREKRQQYEWLEVELGSVKSLKYCYCPPTKLQEGNIFRGICYSVHGGYACPPPATHTSQPCTLPTVWLAIGRYASCWNAILFKLGLNCKMYSWVVHFVNYFVSKYSENDIRTER